jgi:uncharacterized phage-associated protein
MAHGALDIAKVILRLVDPEYGDIISNLKLQKLLYYVQGFHLAMFDRPLFKEDVVAWTYGPVVKEVYQEYKKYGHGAIPQPENDFEIDLTNEQQDLIIDVFNVYGQLSASKLMNLTHEEPPWKNTQSNQAITNELMRTYFLTQLVEENEKS